jgi:alkanesulfonate monooxygenase SsuD/methylene tetrahydromethanopterin reductase-like flavin-dependent oxidoreductase (luciferase family)
MAGAARGRQGAGVGGMPWLTWQQSAQQLMDAVVHDRHHASVRADRVATQLLVDVSAMVREDLKTGIQRVVRAQLLELLRRQNRHHQVLPVYLSDEGGAGITAMRAATCTT